MVEGGSLLEEKRQVFLNHAWMTQGAFFPTGQRRGAVWASAAPNSHSFCFCSTMSVLCATWWPSRVQRGEAEVKLCMLSDMEMTAREPMEAEPRLRLEYHQGWGRQSWVSRWFRRQKAMQETMDPDQFIQIEGIELGGSICLYLPLFLVCIPLLLPGHSPHWHILISVHHLQPVSPSN